MFIIDQYEFNLSPEYIAAYVDQEHCRFHSVGPDAVYVWDNI